jgi:Outer membrane protein beta-barrel domain/PDZ domain
MRHVCVFLFLLISSAAAFAQESRADVFGGYSYLNIDTNGLSSRQSANGWEASISGNFNKWFAVEGEVSGYYKNYSVNLENLGLGVLDVKVTDYSYAAGPRINFKPIFVHALFGGDHLTGSSSGVSLSQDGVAGSVGGGVQWRVSGPWSVRASADYVFTRHNLFGGPSVTQNNVRASAGIVYSFGGTAHATASPHQSTPVVAGTGMKISSLGVMVKVGANPGAEITDEAPNGIAALAGIHVGDVINSVDGKPVSTPMELSAALASHSSGDRVTLGYLIRALWQKDSVVVLGSN